MLAGHRFLNLTRPDVVLGIHRRYLAAGADIMTMNTFTATVLSSSTARATWPMPGQLFTIRQRWRMSPVVS
jgi:hypothetical protein